MLKKRKEYEKPAMQVVELKQPQLLAGSDASAGVQNYTWQDVDEE